MNLFVDSKSGGWRVLHLISSSGFLGAENVVLELAREAHLKGHWAGLGVIETRAHRHRELADAASAAGVEVEIFPSRGKFDGGTVASIKRALGKKAPQLIHSHGYKSNFFALVTGRKHVPWVVTNHLWKRTTVKLRFYAWLDSHLIRRADAVVAVSKEIAADMRSRGVPEGLIRVIGNGVDLNRFAVRTTPDAARRTLGLGEEMVLVGAVASLTPEKGHTTLVAAAQEVVLKFPQVRFLLVGDGPERPRIVTEAAARNVLDKFILAGTRSDIPQVLASLDLFVLPSLNEGLPMALLEASAAGVPVVASAVGAVPEVIVDGKSGILVPPKRPDLLAKGIIRVLSDKQLGIALARRAHERVRQEFSSERMADQYLSLYCELLSSGA